MGGELPEPSSAASRIGTRRVLVLLCASLEGLASGLDLLEVRRWLEEEDGVSVRVVADLCQGPRGLSAIAAGGVEGLVLGLCSWGYAAAKVESRIREAGLDPLGAERVNLGGYCAAAYGRDEATDKAKALLAAAVARARAFAGTGPDNVTAYVDRQKGKVSRRGLFTLPALRYRPVASIGRAQCLAETGCRRCVDVCPTDALRRSGRQVTLDKRRCLSCGLCVVECPTAAIDLPTASPAQFEAEVRELLRTAALPASAPRGIIFACGRAAHALEKVVGREGSWAVGWLPVHVPCAGMVTASWMLGALSSGADAVLVLTCGDGCPFGQEERTEARAAYCRELLRLFGATDEPVRLVQAADLAGALTEPPLRRPRSIQAAEDTPCFTARDATARTVLTLARDYGTSYDVSLADAASPFGIVRINSAACTGCGNCARACPAGALSTRQEDGCLLLDFDPALCTACGQCTGWCPEAASQALRVDRATDLGALAMGRVTLYDDINVRCDYCGGVIAPAAVLRRVEALLTEDGQVPSAVVASVTRRCPSCRVARTPSLAGVQRRGGLCP